MREKSTRNILKIIVDSYNITSIKFDISCELLSEFQNEWEEQYERSDWFNRCRADW